MIGRLYRAVADPRSYWREMVRHGVLTKRRSPREWVLFRLHLGRAFATRMEPRDGVPRVSVEQLFPQARSVVAPTKRLRRNGYNLRCEELVTLSPLVKALA